MRGLKDKQTGREIVGNWLLTSGGVWRFIRYRGRVELPTGGCLGEGGEGPGRSGWVAGGLGKTERGGGGAREPGRSRRRLGLGEKKEKKRRDPRKYGRKATLTREERGVIVLEKGKKGKR